jgi:hypothetical protein
MARLFRLENQELVKADERPFSDEVTEMEPFLRKNARILGDIFIFGEQTISSGRDKRTDLLAVNRDGEILIIELKKDQATTDIITQVLRYKAFWKTNPDSARSLWAQSEGRPEDIEPDWDNYDPKIVIVAPSFDSELIQVATQTNLDIRFVEITRYEHGNSTYVVVDELEPSRTRVTPVASRREYDWKWYTEEVVHGEEQVKIGKYLQEEILKLCQTKGWNISPKFNKWYLAFKYDGKNPFWIEFYHKGKVAICLNLRDQEAIPASASKVAWQWNKNWEHWYLEVDTTSFDVSMIEPALESAYKNTVTA